jgi:hypothetical protein
MYVGRAIATVNRGFPSTRYSPHEYGEIPSRSRSSHRATPLRLESAADATSRTASNSSFNAATTSTSTCSMAALGRLAVSSRAACR